MDDFSRLRAAFDDELMLWPPSKQSFENSLMKAKSHGHGTADIRLTDVQKDKLREVYDETKRQEGNKAK